MSMTQLFYQRVFPIPTCDQIAVKYSVRSPPQVTIITNYTGHDVTPPIAHHYKLMTTFCGRNLGHLPGVDFPGQTGSLLIVDVTKTAGISIIGRRGAWE